MQAKRTRAARSVPLGMLPLLALACRSAPSTPEPPAPNAEPSPASFQEAVPPTEAGPPEAAPLKTLDQLVRQALRVHPELAAQHERGAAARERASVVSSFDDPEVGIRWFLEEIQTRTGPQEWAVGLRQALPAFGKRARRKRAALAGADTQDRRLAELRSEIELGVREAWCELYYLRRAREILEVNLGLIERLAEVVRSRYSVGEVPYSDLARTRIELARTGSRLDDVIDRTRPWTAAMNALLSRESEAPLPEVGELPPLLEVDGEALDAEMERRNPTLALLRSRRAEAEARAAVADIAARPDVKVGLEYVSTGDSVLPMTPDSGADPLIASLSFNLPLRTQRYAAMKREARAEARAASSRLEAEKNALRARLESELYRLREAQRSVELHAEELVPQAEQLLQATETAYRSGTASFFEWVDAERSRLEFELGLARARTDQALSTARMEHLLGRVTTGIGGE